MNNWLAVLGIGITSLLSGVGVLLTARQKQTELWFGWAPAGLGGLLILGCLVHPLVAFLLGRMRAGLHERRLARLEHQFLVVEVTESIIERIGSTGQSLVGDRHPSADALKERWKFNKDIIQAIAPIDNQTAIAGYFIVYPLKKVACKALDNGRVGSARDMQHNQHFCKDFRSASGIYVSMVMGNDEIPNAKACVLHLLLRTIRRCQRQGKSLRVYARPYTEAGYRLVRRYRFQEINAQWGLWKVTLE